MSSVHFCVRGYNHLAGMDGRVHASSPRLITLPPATARNSGCRHGYVSAADFFQSIHQEVTMYDSSFTDRQIEARRAHAEAIRAHYRAGHGEKTRAKNKLEAAAREVLEADNEAERCRKVEAA